jgi:hypothetical protein
MSKQKICGVVAACALLVAFARAQERPEGAPTKITPGAHKVTLNVTHLIGSGFQLSAFVETGSTADVCLATYNASSQTEDLAPILCSAVEFRGKHGIRLFSSLSTHPSDDFVATVTVYQQDAQYYTAPVRCELR